MTGGSRLAAAVLLVVVLAGCGDPGGGPPSSTPPAGSGVLTEPPSVDERFTADIPSELRVRNPKDARGFNACELLTAEQLADLGLDPQTARPDSVGYGDLCSWKFADGSTSAGVTLSVDPAGSKLPDLYRLRSTFQNFEVLQVAGHPAVRADDAPMGECALNVAVADEQVVTVYGYLDGRERSDPCAQARRMAELILSNLPPLA